MSALLDEVFKALANYPIVESAVALLILIFGYRAMREGRRDGPQPAPSYQSHEYPAWMLTGPAYEMINAIHEIKNQERRQTELLSELSRESRRQTQLLENIWNENVINPRRLQE